MRSSLAVFIGHRPISASNVECFATGTLGSRSKCADRHVGDLFRYLDGLGAPSFNPKGRTYRIVANGPA